MAYNADKELRLWLPEGEPKAVVQVIHGMAEYIDRYAGMAEAMNARGIAVAGINHRGHGPRAERLGWFAEKNGWDALISDQRQLTAKLRERFPGVPLVLLGHSMGSFLAREYVLRDSAAVDMLVLSGTGHYPAAVCGFGRLLAKLLPQKKPSGLINGIAFTGNNKPFEPARTPFDWLSRDEKAVDAYIADPLCGFTFTASAFGDFFGGLLALTRTDRLSALRRDLPILLFSGDRDSVGQMGKGVRITEKEYLDAGMKDVKTLLYPEGRHEMFREINKEEVLSALAEDILERAKTRV